MAMAVDSSPTVVDGVVYIRAGVLSGHFRRSRFERGGADLFLRIRPTPTTVHQGDLLTYAFPVWNLGPDDAVHEVLNTQVPAGHNLRLHPHLRHAGAGHVYDSALRGNGANRLPRKQRHGPEHHVDGAPDGEGDGSLRDGDHRKCSHHGGYA